MMRARFLLVFAAILLVGAEARAGTFGGFSRDERLYLRGPDRVCEPFAAGKTVSGFPKCSQATPKDVASLGFRKGTLQVGATARYKVSVRKGTAICVVDTRSGKKAAGWASVDPISRITAVRVSQNGRLVAVEYEARTAGRPVEEVVVFSMPVSGAAPAPTPGVAEEAPSKSPDPGGARVGPAVPDKDREAAQATVSKAWKLVARGKYAKAAALFEQALSLDRGSSEARYGLAVTLARRGKKAQAIAALAELRSSSDPEAVVWRVEARFDKAFKKLLANGEFRKAVGLDVAPGTPASPYERLVGQGGHWEQGAVPCDRARVNLDLQRLPRRFKMRIRNRCQGLDETTRLDGSWALAQGAGLELTFPNVDGPDETMRCGLAVCPDGSGEDCLTCGVGTDMEMKFRVVRR